MKRPIWKVGIKTKAHHIRCSLKIRNLKNLKIWFKDASIHFSGDNGSNHFNSRCWGTSKIKAKQTIKCIEILQNSNECSFWTSVEVTLLKDRTQHWQNAYSQKKQRSQIIILILSIFIFKKFPKHSKFSENSSFGDNFPTSVGMFIFGPFQFHFYCIHFRTFHFELFFLNFSNFIPPNFKSAVSKFTMSYSNKK